MPHAYTEDQLVEQPAIRVVRGAWLARRPRMTEFSPETIEAIGGYVYALVRRAGSRANCGPPVVDALTPDRSGFAISFHEILFTRSQRVQISGQLVPQDPSDEPAENLLERIKASGNGSAERKTVVRSR